MKMLLSFLRSSLLRWWLMIAAVFTIFPACPCCGRQGCAGGFAAGAVLGGLFVAVRSAVSYLKRRLSVKRFWQGRKSGTFKRII